MRARLRQLPLGPKGRAGHPARPAPGTPAAWGLFRFENLPNLLTVSRLILTGVFIWAMSYEGLVSSWVALVVFSVAATTDWLDGHLARRYGLSTPFGTFMDPVADKVLILSALFIFLWQNLVPVWMVLVIVARELTVTSIRVTVLTGARGRALPAMPEGKLKMGVQITAVIGTLVVVCARHTIEAATGRPYDTWLLRHAPWGGPTARTMDLLPDALLLMATLLSVYSGIVFFMKHRKLLWSL
ncbi:MAG: CDP-diacylglycerol--glycerol-3-phosphate 3-phosphatidyltransferase [Candidatus Coatesbacteria bacterium]